MSKQEFGFIDHIYILFKWRKYVIIQFFIVCILAAGLSLILPKVHRAHTTILPPMEESSPLGLSSIISKVPLAGLGLGLGAVSEEAYLFLANTYKIVNKLSGFCRCTKCKPKGPSNIIFSFTNHIGSTRINKFFHRKVYGE